MQAESAPAKDLYEVNMLDEFFSYLNKIKRFEVLIGEKRYYCDISEVLEDKIRVSYPIYHEKSPELKASDKMDVFLYCEGGIYSGEVKVLKIETAASNSSEKPEKIIEISYPENIKHSQRREYLRAKIEAPYVLTLKCKKDDNDDFEVKKFEGLCRNICGKGVNMVLKEQIKECFDAELELEVNHKKILSSGKLVYSQPILVDESIGFSTAFILSSINRDDMEYIIKECFLFQLSERRSKLSDEY